MKVTHKINYNLTWLFDFWKHCKRIRCMTVNLAIHFWARKLDPGFKTQRRRHQKSKTGVSVAPRKGLMSSKNFCITKIKKLKI